ncbi:MAG TPA: endolytic transglycosylase MltG [Clostridiales bacterium]|nr:endolytic transglycosylase MltG [Clostridiales bacterium]
MAQIEGINNNTGKEVAGANNSLAMHPGNHTLKSQFLRKFLIFVISLAIVIGTLAIIVAASYNYFMGPVDAKNDSVITIEIPRGASTSTIASILEKNGLIRNKNIFKLYVDLTDNSTKMQAGKYELKPSMSLEQIMDEIISGKAMVPTKKFTIPEGLELQQVAQALEDKGIIASADTFLRQIQEFDVSSYPLLSDILEDREYKLEGYLFPDTYEVYDDATPEQIIEKMLDQFHKVFNNEYVQRAKELEMTVDQVVTLASIIEREGTTSDFKKISAVFHNRMKKDMPLQSCATIQYIIKERKWDLTTEDTSIESPYNTYINKGLPIGPIASPGKAAIEAALYPDQQFMDEGYLYFVLKDPKTREHAFNKTLAEHNADVKKYRDNWSND